MITLAVIIAVGVCFFSSDSSKLFVASFYADHGYYNKAVDKVKQISSVKGETREDYYLLMSEIDDFLNSGGMDELNNIIESIAPIEEHIYELRDKEQHMLSNITDAIDSYEMCSDDFNEFESDLYAAYNIYSIALYFESGYDFNPSESFEEINICCDNLESAAGIYKKYAYDGDIYTRDVDRRVMDTSASYDGIFWGYKEIKDTIDDITSSMHRLISKYGENADGIYFTKFSYPESPYINSEDSFATTGIDSVVRGLKCEAARNYMEEALQDEV